MTSIRKKTTIALCVLGLAAFCIVKVIAAARFVTDRQPVGYVGQPVASNTNVGYGDAIMYAIDYSVSNWSGNLHHYPLRTDGSIDTVDGWTGGASGRILLQNANPTATPAVPDTRWIVTKSATASHLNGGSGGVAFQWANLSAGAGGQKSLLDPAAFGASATTSNVLDYVRGNSRNEGVANGNYRRRGYGLGDIIHSTPVYWSDSANEKTVFVGANDGMLHAIDAVHGSERFAYIPSALIPKLNDLMDQAYVHEYFVDGRLDVKSFAVSGGTSQSILVGTTGAGGKVVFGLDVTAVPTSEANAATKVLWEISNADTGYGDLGYTYSAPTLFDWHRTVSGADTMTPALVVGNGYNNTGSGTAALFLINATTGALIHEFNTGSGSSNSPNGLSSVSLWSSNGDGKKDTAYAGDIDGNVWKFNLTPDASGHYSDPERLFTTDGNLAITMAPGLYKHPLGGVMVVFVTGRMLTNADATDTGYNYAYGIRDNTANTNIREQTLTERNYTYTDPAAQTPTTIRVRTATSTAMNWATDKGWKTQLPIGGERVVGDGAFVTGSIFQFFSTNPTNHLNSVPSGENWWMQLNVMTGGDSRTTVFDLNNDKVFNADDQVVVAQVGTNPVGRYMGGGVRSQLISLTSNGLYVFQSNYDKNSVPADPTTVTTDPVTVSDATVGIAGGHFDTDFFCYSGCGNGGRYDAPDSYGGVRNQSYLIGSDTFYAFTTGGESGGVTDGLDYIHVHQYDKIFNRTGINVINPSQDLQRLARAWSNTVTASNTTTNDDDGYRANNQAAPWGTSTSTTSATMPAVRYLPTTTVTYSDGPQTPWSAAVLDGDGLAITSTKTATFPTTMTKVEVVNVNEIAGACNTWKNNGNCRYYDPSTYTYKLKTTTYHWTTTVTNTIVTPSGRFKVLLMNQYYSPAAHIAINGTDARVLDFQTASGLTAASLPVYDISTISSLVLQMPVDAFSLKVWGRNPSPTETQLVTGMNPITPRCVGVATAAPIAGPNQEWRNGALTMQIVNSAVTDDDIQLNVVGQPKLGYRLKDSSVRDNLIGEYVIYWHEPHNHCMGESGYTQAPPLATDRTGYGIVTPAAHSNDPNAGSFVTGSGDSGNGGSGSGSGTHTVGTVVTETTNADGTVTRVTVVTTAGALTGTYVITTTTETITHETNVGHTGVVTGGAVSSTGTIDTNGIDKNSAALGRITWREVKQ